MQSWRHTHNLKQTPTDLVRQAMAGLEQERNEINEQKRVLTAEEQADRQHIDDALPLLEQAIGLLEH
jgi:hypothetical protein